MGLVQNIIGLVRDIHGRQQDAKINSILQASPNYLNDNNAAQALLPQINAIDPSKAQAFAANIAARRTAQQQASDSDFHRMTSYLSMLPRDGSVDLGKEVDSFAPLFTSQYGYTPQQFGTMRDAIVANPNVIDSLNPDAVKAAATAKYGAHVLTPGSALDIGGVRKDYVPYGYKAVTARGGDGSSTVVPFDPNTGHFVTGGSAPAPTGQPGAGTGALSVDALRPVFKAQESGGDYTKVNATTGALGAYQVMPQTGAAIAKRLGMPWRPDMMTRSDPQSVAYQDKIGGAAIGDSLAAGGGDPAKVFSHYYSGSPTAYLNPQGNPKTARYVQDMTSRLGGPVAAPGGTVTPTSVTMPGKPQNQVRAATPAEIAAAGYPAGTAAQIDGTGKFVNIKTPSATQQQATQAAEASRNNALSMIQDMRDSLIKLRDDPQLGSTLGTTGALTGWIPGSHAHYVDGLIQQINAGKLATLLTDLKANGNPLGNRILKVEVEQLPKLLANLSRSQNQSDFISNINAGLDRLDAMEKKTRGWNPGGSTGPVKITGDADYAKLPSGRGVLFIGPDGHIRRKP